MTQATASVTSSQFVHRGDYSEVVFSGELFRLGPLQAAVVRQLHEASQSGNPWRPGKELLSNSSASTMRIVDLFKVKKNWRTLIVSDGRGNYRLNLHDRPAARPSHRAYRRLGMMMRIADWGALLVPGNSLQLAIYQLSAQFGRGAPKRETLYF